MTLNNSSLFCNFIQIAEKTYECSKCGVSLVVQDEINEPPLIPCSAPLVQYSASGVKNFISPYTKTENLCSEEEIDKRHSICQECEFFSNHSCSKCGCLLSRDKVYLNKLAIKTESCPLNKW